VIKQFFTSLPLITFFIYFNHAYAGGGFSVKYYNQHDEQVLSSDAKVFQSDKSIDQNDRNEVINLGNGKNAVPNNSANSASTVEDTNNNQSPFSWMSKVGRMNQQYHNDVEKIISQIKVENETKNYNNTQVKIASYNLSNFSKQSTSSNRDKYDHIISHLSNKYGVSAGLVKAVMHTESSFNPNARSPVGAQGLMQLMPATARRFNVGNAYDPQQNIEGGVKYLGWLIKRFDGNLSLALAGYNAGEGNVDKYGDVPPFRETKDYVRRVLTRYHSLYRGL